ncbi:MAG TPA: hypothetical protein VK421_15405 [Pyrinomonadaceae bacterium]|nr:hypothetical protein [Pyrinomonadaceae bacterium]
MATQRTSRKATQQRHGQIVREIGRKFGTVIDLERTPFVLVEIIREFGHRFDDDGGGGGGGVSPGVSTVAVGITPPDEGVTDVLVRTLLTVQRDIKALSRKLDRIAANK